LGLDDEDEAPRVERQYRENKAIKILKQPAARPKPPTLDLQLEAMMAKKKSSLIDSRIFCESQ
tara:strand:- start:178 stop:366 length:189 start_codon:yes stop_codon:yes gene_type:complete